MYYWTKSFTSIK